MDIAGFERCHRPAMREVVLYVTLSIYAAFVCDESVIIGGMLTR